MTVEDFVRLNPDEIRRSNKLMQLFVNFYEAAFFVKPSCAGCVFKKGFKRLKNHIENSQKNVIFDKNTNIMSKKTFKLKSKEAVKIHSYKKDGKIYRSYGYNMTEEFAISLVHSGKIDIFIDLPDDLTTTDDNKNITDYHKVDYREIVLPLYAEIKEKTGEKAISNKKDDIIAFILENEG